MPQSRRSLMTRHRRKAHNWNVLMLFPCARCGAQPREMCIAPRGVASRGFLHVERLTHVEAVIKQPLASVGAGLCQCGCGRQTPVAPQTDRRKGWIKGQPLRFLKGHGGCRLNLTGRAA
jgi:hypothetical protein